MVVSSAQYLVSPVFYWGFALSGSRFAPPRPLRQRRLRSILLMSRPPLLCEEGNVVCAPIFKLRHYRKIAGSVSRRNIASASAGDNFDRSSSHHVMTEISAPTTKCVTAFLGRSERYSLAESVFRS